MNFYTTSTFRKTLEALIEKPKDGYGSVIKDIVEELSAMPDNSLRDTNDRVLQFKDFRLVKLRCLIVVNICQKLMVLGLFTGCL